HDPALAEDAIHEAFARMLKSEARPQRDALAYVFAAVRNAARDARRRLVRLELHKEVGLVLPTHDPVADAVRNEEQVRTAAALEGLGDDDKQVVVLRIYGQLSFEQIAEVCAEPLPTVSTRYRRALVKLRQRLEKVHSAAGVV
ncbi:MAG: sigma-70 family RNA polymerase sigma factor, partial [Phycisphaerae bacterium]